jgi:hypothetical protein
MLTIDTGILVVLSQGVSPVQFLGGRFTMRLPSRGGAAAGAFCASASSVTGLTGGGLNPYLWAL